MRVSVDITFFKNELLRMSVLLLRTIDLEALQIFKAVVDFGGVTRAAAQLHRVPSNVTTRLKQLKEGLGTKLFHLCSLCHTTASGKCSAIIEPRALYSCGKTLRVPYIEKAESPRG